MSKSSQWKHLAEVYLLCIWIVVMRVEGEKKYYLDGRIMLEGK
jgi:hypothetical protein